MLAVRRVLFAIWIYLAMAVVAVGLSPALLMSQRAAMGVIKIWARTTLLAFAGSWGSRLR